MDFEYVNPLVPKTLEYVTTANGTLRGYKTRDVYAFKNVPYGECKRWQTATPVKPWKGIRNALQFGPRMFPGGLAFTPWDSCGVAHEAYDYAEDALNLNIWTTSIDRDSKKPVMVWIHGGGIATGSAMEMQCHDGESLSKFGDVVVVGLNHRLNVFGFLDVSEYGPQYANSQNCGLSDLVLALQWIHDNIAAFGGDPNNVLIYGQSGGGGKVSAIMQTPAADGLYHKAVIMSGRTHSYREEDNSYSEQIKNTLKEATGSDDIRVWEDLTPEDLLGILIKATGYTGGPTLGKPSWNYLKNEYYTGDARKNGLTDYAKTVPVMIGSVFAEFPPFHAINKNDLSVDAQKSVVRKVFPNQPADELIAMFERIYPGRNIVDAALQKDFGDFRLGSLDYVDVRLREATAPTYVYLLDHEFPQDGGRSAWHCCDIPMVFRNSSRYPGNFNAGILDGKLEDAVCSSWLGMAYNGNPNNEYLGCEWPAYTADNKATMILSDECKVRTDFDYDMLSLLADLKPAPSDFKQLVN